MNRLIEVLGREHPFGAYKSQYKIAWIIPLGNLTYFTFTYLIFCPHDSTAKYIFPDSKTLSGTPCSKRWFQYLYTRARFLNSCVFSVPFLQFRSIKDEPKSCSQTELKLKYGPSLSNTSISRCTPLSDFLLEKYESADRGIGRRASFWSL